ncbi:MAG: 16S rRNA (uracil(1498)-N(3))-methyltransferase [candidate division Zixibacteria bacterium]|nr:16S rRNA (uracil(1498)-N(3))-methyltransferase [candidate division Zixibacteria bacterium]
MNLIILTEADSRGEFSYHLTDGRAEHIRVILRSQPGDSVEVGLLDGPQGTAIIEKVTDNEVVLRCGQLAQVPDPSPIVDLICALPRPQTLKKVLLTSATMAVRRIHLIRANRVEKSYFHSPLLQPENYTPFLIEGLSQGKHTRLPEVTIHDRFKPFFLDKLPELQREEKNTLCLSDPSAESCFSDVYDRKTTSVGVAIGPEGGWVPFEIDLMKDHGFQPFSLGRWVLRVETAVAGVLSQLEMVRMMG